MEKGVKEPKLKKCSEYHVDKHRILVSGKTDQEAVERWNEREGA